MREIISACLWEKYRSGAKLSETVCRGLITAMQNIFRFKQVFVFARNVALNSHIRGHEAIKSRDSRSLFDIKIRTLCDRYPVSVFAKKFSKMQLGKFLCVS